MIFAQISDTHIQAPGQLVYEMVDTAAFLRRCVAHINALVPRPDFTIATGDLVNSGEATEYDHLRELLESLRIPCYLLPGNHDERTALRQAFPGHKYLPRKGFLQWEIKRKKLRLIALDTLVPGEARGELCAQRLEWLAERLAEDPDQPTVLLMHHPPFQTGISHMDAMGLTGADKLERIVRAHPCILRILCGHIHRSIQMLWGGTLVSVAPSPAHQVHLDLRLKGEGSFTLEPPAVPLHLWRPPRGLVSHLSFVGDFAGPHPLRKSGRAPNPATEGLGTSAASS